MDVLAAHGGLQQTSVMGRSTARRWAAAALLVVAACSSDNAPAAIAGPTVGLVTLAPSPAPGPGTAVTLAVSSNAPAEAIGGICVSLDRWRQGTWETRWNLQDRSEPSEVRNGELTCPAIGRELPTQLSITLPPDLESGTWRLGYSWSVPVPEAAGAAPTSEACGCLSR